MERIVAIEPPTDGVSVVRMTNDTKRNALSIAMRDQLSDAVDTLAGDDAVRCIVLTGDGSVFSAGFDLAEFATAAPDHVRRLWASSDRFHHTVLRCPLPMIAAVNGPALAGGFDLAVMADLRLATPNARFAHVERPYGDVLYRPLRDLIGGGVARELVLTGRSVDADEALRIGLVNHLVPVDALMTEAMSIAALIARAPRDILMRTKRKIIDTAAIPTNLTTLEL